MQDEGLHQGQDEEGGVGQAIDGHEAAGGADEEHGQPAHGHVGQEEGEGQPEALEGLAERAPEGDGGLPPVKARLFFPFWLSMVLFCFSEVRSLTLWLPLIFSRLVLAVVHSEQLHSGSFYG